jgi:2-polyprenyl-3-methyl-5-hydroxy-6-metoxy-1,4-benzoquinol methylase
MIEIRQHEDSAIRIELPDVACALCGTRDARPEPDLSKLLKLNTTTRQIVSCRGCGFRFLNPFLDDAEIESLYNTESNYFDNYVGTPYLQIAQEKLGYYRRVRRHLERRLSRKGRILDIGSATGHFLSVFKEHGWHVQGLEISDWCREYSEKHFGIASAKATAETACLAEKEFDVISMNHVLEHLRSPLSVLRKIGNWLREDGLLCIEVPNEFNDIVFALSGNWGRKRMYGLPGPILHHQLFFTPNTLRAALSSSGFKVIETRTSDWRAPVPCHLFRSPGLNSMAMSVRKGVLMAGAPLEMGEFILCLATKPPSADAPANSH